MTDGYKMMYKIMYDDLKDADMIVGYAKKLKDEGNKELAEQMINRAKERLSHMMETHKKFKEMASKEKNISEGTVSVCLWEETHEHYQDWYEKIERCIKKWDKS